MTKLCLLIALAGGFGAVCRYVISGLINKKHSPYGTFLVNILGCFIFGLIFSMSNIGTLSEQEKTIILSGFCGAFTTFSTFISEFGSLASGNKLEMVKSIIYLFLSLFVGLCFVLLGFNFFSFFS